MKWTARDGYLYDQSGRLNLTRLTVAEAELLAQLHNKAVADAQRPAGVVNLGRGPDIEVNVNTGEKK